MTMMARREQTNGDFDQGMLGAILIVLGVAKVLNNCVKLCSLIYCTILFPAK